MLVAYGHRYGHGYGHRMFVAYGHKVFVAYGHMRLLHAVTAMPHLTPSLVTLLNYSAAIARVNNCPHIQLPTDSTTAHTTWPTHTVAHTYNCPYIHADLDHTADVQLHACE